jgi:hypothetical protein
MSDVKVEQADRDLLISLRGFGKGSVLEAQVNQGWYRADQVAEIARHRTEATRALSADVKELKAALEWYGEQARLARLIHSEGDSGRHALADDGGKRARAIINRDPVQ